MKILIIRNAFSYDFGGAERFPVNLAVELQKNGQQAIVASRSPRLLAYADATGIKRLRGWWWSRQQWSGPRVMAFPIYLGWQLVLMLWYLSVIMRFKPDVVHPQSKDDFIAATIAAKLLGKKVIWTDHADLKYTYANHQVWYKNPVGKLVYFASRYADKITLVSRSEARLIETALGHKFPAQYAVIHNGVWDVRPVPADRQDAGPDTTVYCSTSRLVSAKGIGELITAFMRLYEADNKSRLWVVGDGPERERFIQLANNHPAIQFLGHSDDPLSYVQAADVFVHPSYHEGFSLSLVEAAMLSKPVVACDTGGNPEIIRDGENGLLVPVRDSDALYLAMQRLQTDRDLRTRLGAAARETYLKEYNFSDIVTQKFIPLYEH